MRIIDHFGLRGHFERVFGSELDGTRVEKTHLLEYALKVAAVQPSRTIMIGDRSHDMIGAKNNGMKAIGVLYGYGSRSRIDGSRRIPYLRHAGSDPRLHFLKATRGTLADYLSSARPSKVPSNTVTGVNLS